MAVKENWIYARYAAIESREAQEATRNYATALKNRETVNGVGKKLDIDAPANMLVAMLDPLISPSKKI